MREPEAAAGRARRAERGEAAPPALWTLRIALLLLLALRAAAAFLPGTWLWGANALRFSAPGLGWALWGAAALALLPALAARAVPALAAAGDAIAAGRAGVRIGAALGAAALVLVFQDRTYFVGDALLRLGTANTLSDPRVLAPGGAGQLLPLDVLLHYHLPRLFVTARLAVPVTVSRGLGALDAALFAVLALELARALELRGAAAAAAAATAFFGGALFLFTGYNKSYTELCVVTAAVGVAALRVVRGTGGLLPLGIAAAAGALLHRSAVALAPAVLLAWWVWLRRPRPAGSWKRAAAGIALPVVAALTVAPRVVRTMGVLDVRRHLALPHAPAAAAGALDPLVRASDLMSFVILTAPLALVVPALLPARAREDRRGGAAAALLALALPFLALLLALRGQEGLYRDWDVFAAAGVALALLSAWLVGQSLGTSRAGAGLAVAVVLAVASPALEWLALFHDSARGLRRAATFAVERPLRPDPERARTWDHLGSMAFSRNDFAGASVAYAHAVQYAPSLRMLYTLGLALERAGRTRDAQIVLRSALRRDSTSVPAWTELRDVSLRLGDLDEARRAARAVAALRPDDPAARSVRDRLDSLGVAPALDRSRTFP